MSQLFHIAIELTDDRQCRRMEKILQAFNNWRLGKDRRITQLEEALAEQHEAALAELPEGGSPRFGSDVSYPDNWEIAA